MRNLLIRYNIAKRKWSYQMITVDPKIYLLSTFMRSSLITIKENVYALHKNNKRTDMFFIVDPTRPLGEQLIRPYAPNSFRVDDTFYATFDNAPSGSVPTLSMIKPIA